MILLTILLTIYGIVMEQMEGIMLLVMKLYLLL